jgi:Lrp/AsnC family leucine-responsive transcriptional regulator
VLLHVRLAASTPPTVFEEYLRGEPGVLQAWQTAGDIDFEVHLVCGGVNDLHALLTRARREGGAQETTTHLILKPADPTPAAAAEHHRKVRP